MAVIISPQPADLDPAKHYLAVQVEVPRIAFYDEEHGDQPELLKESVLVAVEIPCDEFAKCEASVEYRNEKVKEFGPEIAAAFGGWVKGWHE